MSSRWKLLESHHAKVAGRSILSLFEAPDRAGRYTARLGDMIFDFSKTNIDDDGLDLLIALAEGADVAGRRSTGTPTVRPANSASPNTCCQPADASLLVMLPVAAPSTTPAASNVTELVATLRMRFCPFNPVGVAPANSPTLPAANGWPALYVAVAMPAATASVATAPDPRPSTR